MVKAKKGLTLTSKYGIMQEYDENFKGIRYVVMFELWYNNDRRRG